MVVDDDVKVSNSSLFIVRLLLMVKQNLIKGLVNVTKNVNTSQHLMSDVITGKGGGLVGFPVPPNAVNFMLFCVRLRSWASWNWKDAYS